MTVFALSPRQWFWGSFFSFVLLVLAVGFWPGKPTEFVVEYGIWTTELLLERESTDCDSEGPCTTSTTTLDRLVLRGTCLSEAVCESVEWPQQPSHWQPYDDIVINRRSHFTITHQELAGNRNALVRYPEQVYSERMPATLGDRVYLHSSRLRGWHESSQHR